MVITVGPEERLHDRTLEPFPRRRAVPVSVAIGAAGGGALLGQPLAGLVIAAVVIALVYGVPVVTASLIAAFMKDTANATARIRELVKLIEKLR
jgi:hypothetical protein